MKLWRALLVTVLLLCATLCVTSITAAADDSTHTHPICGKSHTDIGDHTGECGDVVWTAWDGTSAIDYGDSNTAYVYLTGNATRNYKLEIRGGYTLYLCLNGFSITSSEDGNSFLDTVVTVYDKAKFVLCNCKNDTGTLTHSSGMRGKGVRVGQGGSDAVFIMYGGTISGNHVEGSDGAGVEIHSGTFIMYGGKITDNHVDVSSNYGGGGVCAQSGGKFTMYGGEISNNTSKNDYGGGIVAWGGSASLYGGTIRGNSSGSNGGGICTNSNLIISGDVRIADNTATGNGGGVYFHSTWGSDTLTISDSVIFANNTAMNGGGIYINDGNLTINGGSITNNTATGNGGGIYINDGNITINGGSITDNTATGNGGGVYFGGNSFKISGNIGIAGNKKNSDANNIYLSNGNRINVEGELTGTVPIGVTTEATPNSSKYVQIASGSAEYATPDKFQYENSNTPISIVSSWYGVTLVVCVHNFGTDWKTDAANHWRECSICKGQSDLSAHIGGSSTCTEKAVCEVCGLPYGNVLSHDFNGGTWQSNADEHWKKCSNCDAIDAQLPHEWNDGEVTLNPTCTTIGQKTFTCTVCHAVKIETLNALGHDFVNHNAKAATCTEKGWEAYETCSRCDYTTYIEINALGHDEVPHEGKAATCTEDGWKPYVTCTRCDYTTYEKIDALGHDEVPHEGKAATCTKDGWKPYVTCTRCDYTTYEKIDALGHDEVPHEGKAATCTEDGCKPYVTCSRCGYTTYEKIDALGHDFANGTWQSDSTMHWKKCSRCDAVNEKAQHVGSMTTCRDSSVCTICSTVYGVLNSDNHVGGIEIRGMIASTAEKAGYTGDIYCKGCNAKLCDGTVIPAISNLSTDMKSELATAAEEIEKVLNDQSGVYTDEQKKQLADSVNAINSALESIDKTEEAVKKVDAMPDVGSTQPDDKAAIDSYEAAKKAYEALSDDEKRMAGESVKAALDDMLRALTDYDVTYGNGSVWTENNNNNGLTFTVNGYHKKFAGIVINGAVVDEKYYEIAAGSTVITLKAEYLQTLPEGKYTLQVQYTDGSTDGDDTFTITKSDSAAASDTTDSPPKTGDNSNLVLLISIMTVCAVVLVILLLLLKKRKQETKE